MMVVDATPDLVPALLERMEAQDRADMDKAGGAARIEALIRSSTLTWCGMDRAGPVLMGGVHPLQAGVGYVWQVITPAVRDHKRAYLRLRRDTTTRGLAEYPVARTFVKADCTTALKRLRTEGWTIGAPQNINGTMACLCEVTR